ncbi:hypothetical protein X743_04145 [Mesorhizobium sp. LNHC252B00]|nr:hypothetical protein X743_04145 [Mesorhizobium sp. LNHC252B00]
MVVLQISVRFDDAQIGIIDEDLNGRFCIAMMQMVHCSIKQLFIL